MVIFTRISVPSDSATCPFGKQLTGICRVLGLVPPIFKGRMIPLEIPTVHRWEIEREILPLPARIPIAPIVYKKEYTTWETGLLLVGHEVLSRICEVYYEMMSPGSPYRHFDRRDAHGLP